jgi:hypothetical protein
MKIHGIIHGSICLISAIMLFAYGECFSASPHMQPSSAAYPPKTLEIMDSLVRNATRLLAKQLRRPLFPQDTLFLQLKAHEGAWLLEQYIFSSGIPLKRFRQFLSTQPNDTMPRPVSQTTQISTHNLLIVRFSDLSVRYFATNDFANVAREAQCVLTGQLEINDGVVQALEPCAAQYQDTILRTLVPVLESRQYSFTTALLPDAMPNFWKQILEPTVIVITAVLVIAIFFFVRTQ